jgi:hypothetical protein
LREASTRCVVLLEEDRAKAFSITIATKITAATGPSVSAGVCDGDQSVVACWCDGLRVARERIQSNAYANHGKPAFWLY